MTQSHAHAHCVNVKMRSKMTAQNNSSVEHARAGRFN